MNIRKLPKRLRKEPLLDAIFEFRFESDLPVVNILPGLIFSKLDGEKKLERLPLSEIPDQIRKNDPVLQYLPLVKLDWNDYSIMIGDKSLSVASKLPYKGWNGFKSVIIKIFEMLKESSLISEITRYSTKYVDIISNDLIVPHEAVSIAVRMGSKDLIEHPLHLRIEIPMQDFTNVVQIVSNASVQLTDGSSRHGLVIDIDTVKFHSNLLSLTDDQVVNALDAIHYISKATFFECLTEDAISILEPEYE